MPFNRTEYRRHHMEQMRVIDPKYGHGKRTTMKKYPKTVRDIIESYKKSTCNKCSKSHHKEGGKCHKSDSIVLRCMAIKEVLNEQKSG